MLATSSTLGDRYRIERELGQGGMATVYLALDLKHHRKVAVKVVRPEIASGMGAERFLREIEIAAGLHHPHILPLYDSGDADGRLFYVMPYVEGESLRARLEREKQLPIEDAVRIAREVSDALSYAHGHGVVHRDIKPENILLESGHAVVADFGIARAVSAAGGDRMTGTGVSIGTPGYMSPEQAAGDRDVDGRSDLYALGCVLYEMLAGEPPFTGPTVESVIRQHLLAEPRSITQLRPAVPAEVAAAVARALSKNPADRFNPVGQFAEALGRGAGDWRGETGRSHVQSSGSTLQSPLRRWAFIAGGLAVALAATAGGWLAAKRGTAKRPVDPKYVVAVLPFESLSADSTKAYIAAGLTEEVTSRLSGLSALRVLNRAAIAPYLKDADRLPKLAKELGVGSVVDGSAQVQGDSVRITVRLTDARTGDVRWTGRYDRALANVFVVQNEVARGITDALQTTLTSAEARRSGRPPTVSLEAYELYQRSLRRSAFRPADNREGMAMLRRAIALDSTFARAHFALARRYLFLGYSGEQAYLDSGLVLARRAIEVDPELAHGYFALGDLQSVGGKLSTAVTAYHKALALDPSHSAAMHDLAVTEEMRGRYDEALRWAVLAAPLDPNNPMSRYHVASPLGRLGDAASEFYFTRAAERFPRVTRLQILLARFELRLGRDAAAMDRARRTLARDPENQEAQWAAIEHAFFTRAADLETLVERWARESPQGRTEPIGESFGAILGLALAARGERARADSLWTAAAAADERDMANGHENPDRPMQLAAIAAIRGDTATAFRWLERAHAAGWKDPFLLSRDPFFDGVRAHPRYRAILAKMTADRDEMRRRAMAAHDTLFRAPGK